MIIHSSSPEDCYKRYKRIQQPASFFLAHAPPSIVHRPPRVPRVHKFTTLSTPRPPPPPPKEKPKPIDGPAPPSTARQLLRLVQY
ncbi:hypothetical protein BU24DRAFT_288971 [Aaosphaeria arxii CBS 175.79]|uniref:Uncharacterized protein n=1 Tax=Aaosphaeria arxii CBS 175.79 TaxID=1450172 RepID=A0A6A5XG03_9PLEO|nr:uncharacterized protein BU24DRAFT_288971 [Aaosphaeria arxii CBS 175.79]KAF2011776.1 hypothetical protein BU24DRAFT_288971 [Aaosphaeria arxii CBS 175.79]